VIEEKDGRREEDGTLPEEEDMCEVAPVSKYQSDADGDWVGMPAD